MSSLVNDEKLITLIVIGSLITVLLVIILIVLIRKVLIANLYSNMPK